jgi:PEGA domain
MIELTGYNDSGNILEVISASDSGLANANKKAGVNYITGRFDYLKTYILNGQPTERPAAPVTLSGLTLQGVPAGSTLTINGERYDAEGNVELEFPLPGTYRLRVECWPYKDWEGEVTVPVLSGAEA